MNDNVYCPIPSVPQYLACNNGDVINTRTGNVLKPNKKQSGYYELALYDEERKPHYMLVHRIIAECFCENPDGHTEVNHKDGNKANNNASNLEWVSHAYNLKHAYETGLREQDVSPKKVIATNLDTGESLCFSSIYKAARFLNISQGNICMCCKKIRPYASGYRFEYLQEGGDGE